jgi:hypothetical protein
MISLCPICLKVSTGMEMRCGPLQPWATCGWCGWASVLHEVSRDQVDFGKLPSVAAEEGVWWLKWPTERQGPFPSAASAWSYWGLSLGGTRHCEDEDCRVCGKPKRPARREGI